MEDLKQIQEFFSKPLNEISKEDAWKKFQKEKSVTDKTIKAARKDFEKEWEAGNLKENSRLRNQSILIEPAEIKYTESFGTGIKAPGVLHKANAGAFLGAEGAYIIVLPGGTFYVDEDTETAMPIWPLKDQSQALHKALDFTPFAPKYEEWKSWIKNPKTLGEETVEVDDETEFKLDLKHLLDKHVVEQGYSLTKENETDMEIKVGDYQTKYFYICPGAKSLYQDIEDKVEDMGLAIRAAKLQDALFAIEASALESGATEAEVFAAQSIADQIMAMAAMMGLDKEHSYIQGHVEKIKNAVGKEQVDEGASTEEKRMAMQAIKRFAKYRGVSEKEAKADLLRAVKELGSIEEAINEIVETIQAGKVLEEKLCKKGEAYRKRRMAAGEKSSAYLSGRAVKVCKGQISGKKKK